MKRRISAPLSARPRTEGYELEEGEWGRKAIASVHGILTSLPIQEREVDLRTEVCRIACGMMLQS